MAEFSSSTWTGAQRSCACAARARYRVPPPSHNTNQSSSPDEIRKWHPEPDLPHKPREGAMSTNGVGCSCAKRASGQRARGNADRVINQMIDGQADGCSCTGHSTRRAQHAVLLITSLRIITGLLIDLRRENLSPASCCGGAHRGRGACLRPSCNCRPHHIDLA